MQRIRIFERTWFSEEPEIESQVNDHLAEFPKERVISMTFNATGTGENHLITSKPRGYDTLVILVEVTEESNV